MSGQHGDKGKGKQIAVREKQQSIIKSDPTPGERTLETAADQKSPFLTRLNRDCRLMIYYVVLGGTTYVLELQEHDYCRGEIFKDLNAKPNHLALLLACRTTNSEASAIPYQNNRFIIKKMEEMRGLIPTMINPLHRDAIRTLAFEINTFEENRINGFLEDIRRVKMKGLYEMLPNAQTVHIHSKLQSHYWRHDWPAQFDQVKTMVKNWNNESYKAFRKWVEGTYGDDCAEDSGTWVGKGEATGPHRKMNVIFHIVLKGGQHVEEGPIQGYMDQLAEKGMRRVPLPLIDHLSTTCEVPLSHELVPPQE